MGKASSWIVLHFNLGGQASDLWAGLRDNKLASVNCVYMSGSTLHNKDPPFRCLVTDELQKLMNLRQGRGITFWSPVSYFCTALKIQLFRIFMALSVAISALVFLANVVVYQSQSISTLQPLFHSSRHWQSSHLLKSIWNLFSMKPLLLYRVNVRILLHHTDYLKNVFTNHSNARLVLSCNIYLSWLY